MYDTSVLAVCMISCPESNEARTAHTHAYTALYSANQLFRSWGCHFCQVYLSKKAGGTLSISIQTRVCVDIDFQYDWTQMS